MEKAIKTHSLSRIDWIDIAKGIGIFLMVMGHTSIPKLGGHWIYSFHMPLFFFFEWIFIPVREIFMVSIHQAQSQNNGRALFLFCCFELDCL